MKKLTLALLLSLLALALVACGSSEDDYASEVSDVVNPLGEELQAAGAQATAATSEDDVAGALADSEATLGEAASELEAIEPPEDVADLHEELVTAIEGYQGSVAETQEAIESGAPASEISGFLTESQTFATDLNDLRDQFIEAGIPFEEGSE